jgi:hypothetical protein
MVGLTQARKEDGAAAQPETEPDESKAVLTDTAARVVCDASTRRLAPLPCVRVHNITRSVVQFTFVFKEALRYVAPEKTVTTVHETDRTV